MKSRIFFKKNIPTLFIPSKLSAKSTLIYVSKLIKVKRNNETNHINFLTDADDNKISFKNYSPTNYIEDIREHDIPYYIRVAIDNNFFVGKWYSVNCSKGSPPSILVKSDLLRAPELVIFAFDIETTKPVLKFPDASHDAIIIISYVINGQGFLLVNREIVSQDVENFEYMPKPELNTQVIIFNEPDEKSMLLKWISHINHAKPDILVTYNGDMFDWPFIDTRCKIHRINLYTETGYFNQNKSEYLSAASCHIDCIYWVRRDSYLPIGSHGLKAVTKIKLHYNPVEVDPEEICPMAYSNPKTLANYAISDAVATYYLYMQYVHPFIYALCTIIPMKPVEILRKGSGTCCESILMTEAFQANIIYPNKQKQDTHKFTKSGHLLESETYVGGHVEAIEAGVFRADLPYYFKINKTTIEQLQEEIAPSLRYTLTNERHVDLSDVTNFNEICNNIHSILENFKDNSFRHEKPVIYHLDVGAMYPNIMLTNKLQPPSIVDESVCASCDFNIPNKNCQRRMDWVWRGDYFPVTFNEYLHIKQQLQVESLPSNSGKGDNKPFSILDVEEQDEIIRKRISEYSYKVYGKRHVVQEVSKNSLVCQLENSFFIDSVRKFRDRRYKLKGLLKSWKERLTDATEKGSLESIKECKDMYVLYDSLQLAHKCILNSFYGYAMRRGV
ncbi:hypothetical protein MXB_2344 [Myxobolus squamalis]|nr:hypothetical protein MXB_2344 [Myxobolus squamalis]